MRISHNHEPKTTCLENTKTTRTEKNKEIKIKSIKTKEYRNTMKKYKGQPPRFKNKDPRRKQKDKIIKNGKRK